MIEIFNTANEPITGVYFGLFALIPLAISYFDKSFRGWFPTALIAVCLLMSAIPLWDQLRVRGIIAKGKDLHITRGTITQQWHIENWRRERDRIGVVTTVSEGFDVGNERFSWNVGSSYSPATFTNQDDPPVHFEKGQPAEVTWFTDVTSGNERRIVKLMLGGASHLTHPEVTEGKTTGQSSFELFIAQFMQAIAQKDKALTQQFIKFPFMLGGHKVSAKQMDYLQTGLFTPYTAQCLTKAVSHPNSDGSRRIICGGSIFKFTSNKAGSWLLTDVYMNGKSGINHQ